MKPLLDIVQDSFDEVKRILFKPFSFKKWIILVFVMIMAGNSFGGNFNFNFPSSPSKQKAQQDEQKAAVSGEAAQAQEQKKVQNPKQVVDKLLARATEKENGKILLGIMIFIFTILILGVTLLFMWLYSRFAFIFIEDIAKNDASIKKPFFDNQPQGDSYFLFNIIIGAITLMIFAALGAGVFFMLKDMGIFAQGAEIQITQVILSVIPYVLLFFLVILILAFINTGITDILLPVMYVDKIRVKDGFKKALGILKGRWGDFIKYCLLKAVLYIAAGIILSIAMIIVFIVLGIIGAIIGLIVYGISRLIPEGARVIFFIIIGIVATPFIIAFVLLSNLFALPLGVFFRVLGLKYIGRIEEQYSII